MLGWEKSSGWGGNKRGKIELACGGNQEPTL